MTYAEKFTRRLSEQEQAEQRQRDQENAEAKERWLLQVEAERQADLQKTADALDAELAPQYRRQKAEWLTSNPGRPVAEFDTLWSQHMRPVLVEDLHEARVNLAVAELRASGKYRI